MGERYYFTRRGMRMLQEKIRRLEDELQRLESQVAHVAEVGGNQYHDNASYELLVIDIRAIDYRLSEAHGVLNRAVVVDPPLDANRVAIGTRVRVVVDGEEQTYVVAGYEESDPDSDMIAYNTPLAQLILGKVAGEGVVGEIAGRRLTIDIVDVSLDSKQS